MPLKTAILILVLTPLVVTSISAHESPAHTVEQLNKHIQAERSPENLARRAAAYLALAQLENASTDLLEAITIQPDNLAWRLELCRVQLAASKPAKALNTANQALKLSQTPAQRAGAHMLRAEAYHLSHRPKPSLQACQHAFREVPQGEIEWFLLRSVNQLKLGLHRQRINGLKTGLDTHHSAVLKAHWIDAIIDSSDFKTALPLVEAELTDRRWKSSWLIKRARNLQGLERNTEAQADLHTALAEINTRLNPSRPDPLLLADQGTIYAMLGDNVHARECLKKLQNLNAPHWITSRLESLLTTK